MEKLVNIVNFPVCSHTHFLYTFVFLMWSYDSIMESLGKTLELRRSKKNLNRSSYCGSAVTNLPSIHKDGDLILGPDHWVKELALW